MKNFTRIVLSDKPLSFFNFKAIAGLKTKAGKVFLLLLLLCGISKQSYAAATLVLSGGSPTTANTICQGATQVVIYTYTVTAGSTANGITNFSFTTTGTAISGTDITNFTVWTSSVSATFAPATAVQLGPALTTGLGGGAGTVHTETVTFTAIPLKVSSANYIFITATIPATATPGNTIKVDGFAAAAATYTVAISATVPLTNSSGSTPTGNTAASGVWTIVGIPTAIISPATLCTPGTVTLSDAITVGTWSSGTISVASIGSVTGSVTAGAAGTTTISYSNVCGTAPTVTITVIGAPGAISGSPTTICNGGITTTLSNPTTGGTWSSGTVAVASVGSATGLVTSGSAGAAMISYSTGCGATATATVTVLGTPGAITGPATVCKGLTIRLSDAAAGGTWSSATSAVATVGSLNRLVTGVSPGSSVITYSNMCGSSAYTVTVNPIPAAITGVTNVCIGGTTSLSDATAGGTWSSSNTTFATVSSGTVYGAAAGTPMIIYTLPTSCVATTTLLVNPGPASITGGVGNICVAAATVLSDASTGGTWSSSNTGIATVSGSVLVTGVSAGTAIISYSNGCGTAATATVTVNPLPLPITGLMLACTSLTTPLTDATAGGTWSSGTTTIATVNPASGVVYGITVGAAPITYALSTTCMITTTVNVNPPPGPISGINTVCDGQTITLSDNITGGFWSTAYVSLATVGSATGVVTGVNAGLPIISYITGSACFAVMTVTVNPEAPITGASSICDGSTTYLANIVGGGTWSSTFPLVASIGSINGFVTGLNFGGTTITYATPAGCTSTTSLTVVAIPPAITGTMNTCPGATTTLHDATTIGVWSSDNTGVATVSSAGGTGTVYGVFADTTTINYTVLPGCSVSALVLVNPLPAPISGNSAICATLTDTLHDASPGGIWTTTTASIATVNDTSGVVFALTGGNAVIVYTLPATGCKITDIITVHPLPVPVITYNWATASLYVNTGYSSYQWYDSLQGLIPGATSPSLAALYTEYYYVVVTDGFGCVGMSALYEFNTSVLGMTNTTNELIKVYPNPANTTVYIASPVNVRAVVTSIDGKKQLEQPDAKEIDVSKLADGLYFITLYDDDGEVITTRKLIKQ